MDVIPHGAHDVPRHDPALLQKALAIQGSPVLVTFGLMSPGKGIEYMLDALPAVVSRHPRAVYLVVGATHPAVEREQGQGASGVRITVVSAKMSVAVGSCSCHQSPASYPSTAYCLPTTAVPPRLPTTVYRLPQFHPVYRLLSTDYRSPAVFGQELEHRFAELGACDTAGMIRTFYNDDLQVGHHFFQRISIRFQRVDAADYR